MLKFLKILVLLYIAVILVGIGLVCFMTVVAAPLGLVCWGAAGRLVSAFINQRIDQNTADEFAVDEWWEVAGLPKPKGY